MLFSGCAGSCQADDFMNHNERVKSWQLPLIHKKITTCDIKEYISNNMGSVLC